MALIRAKTQIVVKQEVVAAVSNVKAFTVDVAAKTVTVNMEYGNMVDGRFVPVAVRQHVIRDVPAHCVTGKVSVVNTDSKMLLPHTPMANLRVESVAGQIYFEGVDYTRNGNVLTAVTIPEGAQVKASYSYEEPATFDFSGIAAGAVDGEKNLYSNIKAALWEKLLELGLEEGTVE